MALCSESYVSFLFLGFTYFLFISDSLGASNIKIPKGNLGRARVGDLQPRSDVRKWMGRKPFQYAGLAMSQPLEKAFTVFCGQSSEAECKCSLLNHTLFKLLWHPLYFIYMLLY